MRELFVKDIIAMVGVLLAAILWFKIYLSTKKKIFILVSIITIVSGVVAFMNMGFGVESFKSFFKI
ncbi:hypothetical protein [Kurthia sp. Dielmo]|uniref:hypothetical protein n=1 Tax=Kurthia sp. Dielmo TaxID=1033738 RepID=UPI0011200189|nr:hypothetical protein [Kurthia sp. Dielmo]